MTAELSLIHAYRHLYRGALRAVMYSSPARITVRNQLRQGFRDETGTLDPEAVKRTLWFLDAAAKERGLEHKILKNLVAVRGAKKSHSWRYQYNVLKHMKKGKSPPDESQILEHFEMTLAMLNKSMGLCLR
jgi:hypothetical protein